MPCRFLSCLFSGLVALAVAAAGQCPVGGADNAVSAPPPRPRLVVLVVFDQLRGDYLERWEKLFGPDGFRRLTQEGTWFTNCHYPYAVTETGPGHASFLTGCSPERHGIIANEWFDRQAGALVNCATSDRYQPVPPRPAEPGKEAKKIKGASPDRLLVPTFGDMLKEVTSGRGRIVALSMKDRSAVLPAGRRPDACYWFDTASGSFVTSTYYRDQLAAWVATFNKDRPADRWFGHDWDRLRPDLDYIAQSGPDEVFGEGKGYLQGRTFPHPLTGGLSKPGKEYYEALYTSPFANDLLLQLAKYAIRAEELGRDSDPDLLCLSFSGNDPVGHVWGPDSQEVLDTMLRSDLVLEELLTYLDARVGKGRYLLALTADHGVCPLPELTRGRRIDAGRVLPALLQKQAEEFLTRTFGKGTGDKPRWFDEFADWVYLNRRELQQRGLDAGKVEEELSDWLAKQPGIHAGYTRAQMARGFPEGDALGRRVQKSFHPERSGDLLIVPKPYHLFTSRLTGTGHGTPHPYDTHVPLLVYGPGVRHGKSDEPVTPQAIAAIFAQAVGTRPPAAAEAPVPKTLFAEP